MAEKVFKYEVGLHTWPSTATLGQLLKFSYLYFENIINCESVVVAAAFISVNRGLFKDKVCPLCPPPSLIN